MTLKRALVIALTVAAVLPASAAAQEQITPPDADSYLGPVFINGGQGMKTGDVLGIAADTTNYTTQDDLYNPGFDADGNPVEGSGGPPEPTFCEGFNTRYANTIWSIFRAKQYGVITIDAASGTFDEVIRVVPFDGPSNPAPALPGSCFDNIAGVQQAASGLVFPNEWFAVQVGGTPGRVTPAQGGPMQVKFSLGPPPKVKGDASLFWARPPLRVTTMDIKGVTKGAKVTLTCTKGACKKTTKTASKPFWTKPLAPVGPAGPGIHMKGATKGGSSGPLRAFRPVAHAAKTKFNLLKNRKVKKGATITLRITAPGFIGRRYFWKVKKKSITDKQLTCTNPGSSKPQKPGKCHG
jgi:hypothetical protein